MAEPLDSRVEEILQGGDPPLLSRIEKLLKEGGAGGGSVTPEQIAAAVEAYLDEHGVSVTETDPTVPEWAKQPDKPTYNADEVGALAADTRIPPDPSWYGEWRSDIQYYEGGFVSYNGAIYQCKIDSIGVDPDENPQYWAKWFDASNLNALAQHQDIATKLDKSQGAANAGKFMVVGSDGNIIAVTMSAWQGGSY